MVVLCVVLMTEMMSVTSSLTVSCIEQQAGGQDTPTLSRHTVDPNRFATYVITRIVLMTTTVKQTFPRHFEQDEGA